MQHEHMRKGFFESEKAFQKRKYQQMLEELEKGFPLQVGQERSQEGVIDMDPIRESD